MIGQRRAVSQHTQANYAHRTDQQKAKDFQFIKDICSWFGIALLAMAIHIMFLIAFAVTAPLEDGELEDWISLARGFRVMAVLFDEIPFVFKKAQWIPICHRYCLPSYATEFGSTMRMVQHLILIWVIEPQIIQLWRFHQLEEPLLGQSTGVLLTTFVVVTAVVALRKLVERSGLIADLKVSLACKQRESMEANARDTAVRHD
ncbi:uncharacterized protein ColSpa_08228 [Colletotrichum spaethianum]|uniref:Uncharacterized protein n=1 Tax=Colletotrichum spaethianum TaxID=700344 RepID=A0AA37UQ33_9PEZI|nr:uncharacterized protein ColSpa_08228 [Colletotrichum spaethianum]GKT48047.1 hypothetical protein ColSpa_08228 [Colletotrichum spaethianum]